MLEITAPLSYRHRSPRERVLIVLIALALSDAHLIGAELGTYRPALTLRVVKQPDSDDRVLFGARKEATEIMARAGVLLVWLVCDNKQVDASTNNPCFADRGPLDFWVRITNQRPTTCSRDVLAFSEFDDALGMSSAAVYYPAVLRAAKDFQVSPAAVLGYAIAHEIGHLILGANAHVGLGIMSPRWERSDFKSMTFSGLNFDARQAQLLRAEVAQRQYDALLGRAFVAQSPRPPMWKPVVVR